jgi:signal transduction histidine kinase
MRAGPRAAHIFDKFTQGATEGCRSGNRGLGLTFVRMVARAHGGDFTVEDSVPSGATFVMWLLQS